MLRLTPGSIVILFVLLYSFELLLRVNMEHVNKKLAESAFLMRTVLSKVRVCERQRHSLGICSIELTCLKF